MRKEASTIGLSLTEALQCPHLEVCSQKDKNLATLARVHWVFYCNSGYTVIATIYCNSKHAYLLLLPQSLHLIRGGLIYYLRSCKARWLIGIPMIIWQILDQCIAQQVATLSTWTNNPCFLCKLVSLLRQMHNAAKLHAGSEQDWLIITSTCLLKSAVSINGIKEHTYRCMTYHFNYLIV